ncbi:hypothetical protein Q31b_26230 [Novipirellula aureliae]|uniref:Prenyltransferase and squalene oxidase repeat protein n=1 Tax=Novipirellula aureliae TaxID=2527966 RepID=A0A5C6DY53_9BACT|nr:hypothetical protein [Novipirellula aureliae]TWU41184.1 hypothetical protein Q31b_26230 [Novipirellula aureliae]
MKIVKRILSRFAGSISPAPNELWREQSFLESIAEGTKRAFEFEPAAFKQAVSAFVDSVAMDTEHSFRYSLSNTKSNAYAMVFAVLVRRMIGRLSRQEKDTWKTVLDTYQCKNDGLFKDPVLSNHHFDSSDWWGARHLTLLALNAYDAIDRRPKYELRFLNEFIDFDVCEADIYAINRDEHSDLDNKLMNVVCAMQYCRDRQGVTSFDTTIESINRTLLECINPETGLWIESPCDDPDSLSRAVQCAYHYYSFLIYDGNKIPYPSRLIDSVLRTQNVYGGYAPRRNASACEDIDSLHLLLAAARLTDYRQQEMTTSVKRFFNWAMANQNADGGFVFSRQTAFCYGHEQMATEEDVSHLFGTWFRTLSIALASHFLWREEATFDLHVSPGYYFLV